MGTTESLFLDEEVPPNDGQGAQRHPSSPDSSAQRQESQPQEGQRQQSRQKPKKKLPPIKRISGLILGKPGTGKRTLLQRLDGIDPFDNAENDKKPAPSTVTLPYICPPNSKSWDRILFQARASEVVNSKSDFTFILLHPEHDLEATKAYVCAVVTDVLRYAGYKNGKKAEDKEFDGEPICICVLFNFRDLQKTEDNPSLQNNVQQWIDEILQPAVAKENVLLRFIPTSLKNRYGLSIVHNVIYEVYLHRRKADLISKLKATKTQIQNTKQPSLMSYEIFAKTLVQNPNNNRIDPQVAKRRQLTPRMQSNQQRREENEANEDPQQQHQHQHSQRSQPIESDEQVQRGAVDKKKRISVPSSRLGRAEKYQHKQKKASAPLSLEAFLASSSDEDEPASKPKRVASTSTFQSSDDDDDFYYDERGHKRFSYTHHHQSDDSDSSSSDDEEYVVPLKKELTPTSIAKQTAVPGSSKDKHAPMKSAKRAETQPVAPNHRDAHNVKDSKASAVKNMPQSNLQDDTISARGNSNPIKKRMKIPQSPFESSEANAGNPAKATSPKTRTEVEESESVDEDYMVDSLEKEEADATEKKHISFQNSTQKAVQANSSVAKDISGDGDQDKSDDQVDGERSNSISATHANARDKKGIATSSQETPLPSSPPQGNIDESNQATTDHATEEGMEDAVLSSQEQSPPSPQDNYKDERKEADGDDTNEDMDVSTQEPSSSSPKERQRESNDSDHDNDKDDAPQCSSATTDINHEPPPTSNPTLSQPKSAVHVVHGDDGSDDGGFMVGSQPQTDGGDDNEDDDSGFVINATADNSGATVSVASVRPEAAGPAVHNDDDSDDEGFMIGSAQPQTADEDDDDDDGFVIDTTTGDDRGDEAVPPPTPSPTENQATTTPVAAVLAPQTSVLNDAATAAPSNGGLSSAALAAIAAAQKEAEAMMMATNTHEVHHHDGSRSKPKKKKKSEKKEKKKKKKKDKSGSGGDVSP